MRGTARVCVVVCLLLVGLAPSAHAQPPSAFNPLVEARNYAITLERQAIYDTPAYQARLAALSIASGANAVAAQAADPERVFVGDLCWSQANGCAGDIRLDDWATNGDGLVRPVLFTARNGATLSGHVWATVAGPSKRPAVVITNGSVQADEQLYWFAAQTLAKAGYVVLTFDPQGQGQSDGAGQAPDTMEGVPSQTDGRPFYDGTEDALDFLLSTPAHPYEPVPSCMSGTSHAAKQRSRVARGLDAAFDPYWQLINPSEIGLAGHSYGAAGVSYIAQWDPRVKAVVAWDNLGGPGPNAAPVPGAGKGSTLGEQGCPADPAARRVVPIRVPGLGISADYGLPPTPNVSLPDPTTKSVWSHNYTAAGVDSGELIIRGGSHLDFSFIPNQAFGASLRGPDLTDWYTTAWFDKYLRHDRSADARLLSQRWRRDAIEASVDPSHDGNAFSFYYPSRLDIRLASGRRFDCENLRDGCPGLVSADGYRGTYSYVAIDTTPDAVHGSPATTGLRGGSSLRPCAGARATRVRLRRIRGHAVTRVVVFLDGRRVLSRRARRGRALRSVTVPPVPGRARHTVRVIASAGAHRRHRITLHVYGCGHRVRARAHRVRARAHRVRARAHRVRPRA